MRTVTNDKISKSTQAVPAFTLPALLPDDAAALKALLLEQQQTVVAQLAREREDFDAQLAREREQFNAQLTHERELLDARLAHATHEANEKIERLLEQILLARRRQFGTSSEQTDGQAWLFDEAEVLASLPEPDEAGETDGKDNTASDKDTTTGGKRRGKRKPLPPELPRIDVMHELAEADRVCPCGCQMKPVGQRISEQLDIVPMPVRVLRHVRVLYACQDKTHAPVTAPLPAQALPKSNAGPGLLAMLLTTKFVDGLLFARFEKVLARSGVKVPRQTMARNVIELVPVLQPLFNLMREQVFDHPVVHMDETGIQVLKEPGRDPTSKSYMWVQTGGPPDKPVVIFDYDASRSSEVPKHLLAGYRGFLMTDGYNGYNALVRSEAIEHQACLVHARRRFIEAKAVQLKGKTGRADLVLKLIAKLYKIEKHYKDASDSERFLARCREAIPILKQLRKRLNEYLIQVTPRSALGTAVAYMDKYWPRLMRYAEWGYLPIDNNRAENAIRPFVMVRSLCTPFVSACKHWNLVLRNSATRAPLTGHRIANRFGVQICGANLVRRTRHNLFGRQVTLFDQPANNVIRHRQFRGRFAHCEPLAVLVG